MINEQHPFYSTPRDVDFSGRQQILKKSSNISIIHFAGPKVHRTRLFSTTTKIYNLNKAKETLEKIPTRDRSSKQKAELNKLRAHLRYYIKIKENQKGIGLTIATDSIIKPENQKDVGLTIATDSIIKPENQSGVSLSPKKLKSTDTSEEKTIFKELLESSEYEKNLIRFYSLMLDKKTVMYLSRDKKPLYKLEDLRG
jgi:hypothetical protein